MRKAIIASVIPVLAILFYACDKDDNTNPVTTGPTQLTTTLSSQAGSTASTATGSFTGSVNPTTSVLSYTVSYAGINPTAITLDPVSASTTSGTSTSAITSFSNSILLAGAFPTISTTPGSGTTTTPGSGTTTTPGSGTSTTPGSGTTTTPGSGTETTPGSGTSTIPGSGTSTTPGSGTSTTPGSGTSTTPGSGTGTGTGTGVVISSPVSGTASISSTRADSLNRGLYRINIRSSAYPNGEIGGVVQPR